LQRTGQVQSATDFLYYSAIAADKKERRVPFCERICVLMKKELFMWVDEHDNPASDKRIIL
jgi:hypothetical protein